MKYETLKKTAVPVVLLCIALTIGFIVYIVQTTDKVDYEYVQTLTYRWAPGFASPDDHSSELSIDFEAASGTLRHYRLDTGALVDEQTFENIPARELKDLKRVLREIGFFELSAAPDQLAADAGPVSVTATTKNATHTVESDESDEGLFELRQVLYEMLGRLEEAGR